MTLVLNCKNYLIDYNSFIKDVGNIETKQTEVILIPPTVYISQFESLRKHNFKIYTSSIPNNVTENSTGYESTDIYLNAHATGFIINHNEKQVDETEINNLIIQNNPLTKNSILCVNEDNTNHLSKYFNEFKYILYEPTNMIGNHKDNFWVTQAENIIKIKNISVNSKILLGGGFHNSEDFKKINQFGFEGFAISSYVMKDQNPAIKIIEIVNELNNL